MEKLIYGGDGLARLDGRVIFTPFVLPGERVTVEPRKEKPGLVHARTLEVLEPSPDRVAPPCPYFGRCGGCHYQHITYERQLEAKRAILIEELRRLGKIEPPAEIRVIAAEPFGYRNRVQLQVENGKLGYLEARSHKLCAIDHCPISSPKINQTIQALTRMLPDRRWPRMIRSLEIFTDETSVQLNVLETERPVARRFFEWCAENIPGLVESELIYDERFRVSRRSFFQVNRFLLQALVDVATEGAAGESAWDLYAGVGLFVPALASRFRSVTAVESGAGAVRDLQFNAERLHLEGVRAEARTVEEFLQGQSAAPEFILLDPPRAGLGKVVVRRLAELKAARMALVACDPATMARDLSGLLSAGYRMEGMALVDLFPQTYHLETIVQLSRE